MASWWSIVFNELDERLVIPGARSRRIISCCECSVLCVMDANGPLPAHVDALAQGCGEPLLAHGIRRRLLHRLLCSLQRCRERLAAEPAASASR